jgi:hypothetical protein
MQTTTLVPGLDTASPQFLEKPMTQSALFKTDPNYPLFAFASSRKRLTVSRITYGYIPRNHEKLPTHPGSRY